jgi:cytochrome b subunit of formate dehydrogenase
MKIRPTSVTVICWILIVLGGVSLITSTLMWNNPMTKELMARGPLPVPVQYAMMYVGILVMDKTVRAFCMLSGILLGF